ncbi:type II secretion system protein [Salmonella enterica]|nr:type II secretion system protein [Salmonella enterica]
MVNRTAIRKSVMISKSRGFSLLEIIFVLAFMGIILLAVGNYVRKAIDERTRQTAAEAVAQEVYGVLQFINADSIETISNDGTQKRVTNPLYQTPGTAVYPDAKSVPDAGLKGLTNNPVWLAHPNATQESLDATKGSVSPYIARNYSTSLTSLISNSVMIPIGGHTYYSHSLKWSQAIWGQDSVRGYFTDSVCQGGNVGAGNTVYFKQQFLSCSENPVFKNSEIALSRIDLINDKGSFSRYADSAELPVGITRVDVYISFTPVDNNPARIEQFIAPLMTAFRLKKITPNTSGIYLVRKLNFANDSSAFTLLDKTSGQKAVAVTPGNHLALFSDLPFMTDKLEPGRTYAIRFSFDGKEGYLRADGLTAATKVCWDTNTNLAGPCLTSPSQDALVLKRRDEPNEFANLQVGNVISKGSRLLADGKVGEEYYTAPQIRYMAFGHGGDIPPAFRKTGEKYLCLSDADCNYHGPTPDEIVDTLHGAIAVPLQSCPQNVVNGKGEPVYMNPRLSVAVSSVISGLRKGANDEVIAAPGNIFNKQDSNLNEINNKNNADISINRLGGVVFQTVLVDRTWRVGALVATEDIHIAGKAWQYYNPPWLSVMITTWCSSVQQP